MKYSFICCKSDDFIFEGAFMPFVVYSPLTISANVWKLKQSNQLIRLLAIVHYFHLFDTRVMLITLYLCTFEKLNCSLHMHLFQLECLHLHHLFFLNSATSFIKACFGKTQQMKMDRISYVYMND